MERLTISREYVIKKMENAVSGEMELKANELCTLIEVMAAPVLPNDAVTSLPSPRQYACCENAINRIVSGNFTEAWWEIYDFVEAGEGVALSPSEGWVLCLLLEIFVQKM